MSKQDGIRNEGYPEFEDPPVEVDHLEAIAKSVRSIAFWIRSIAFWWWVFVVLYIGKEIGTLAYKLFPPH